MNMNSLSCLKNSISYCFNSSNALDNEFLEKDVQESEQEDLISLPSVNNPIFKDHTDDKLNINFLSTAEKTQEIFQWSDLTIKKQIYGGKSRCSVYSGTWKPSAGKLSQKIIVKLVRNEEFKIISQLSLKNHYVVRLIGKGNASELKKARNSDLIKDELFYHAIIMEKLQPSQLHSPEKVNDFDVVDFYYRNDKRHYPDGITFSLLPVQLTSKKIQDMISLLEIIQYCHSYDICHSDIKQTNLGVDSEEKLKIFDFGESSKWMIGEKNGDFKLDGKTNDIIALGFLFINILVDKEVIVTGRHYVDRDRWALNQNDLYEFVDLLSVPTGLKSIIKKALNRSDGYNPNLIGELISDLNNFKSQI